MILSRTDVALESTIIERVETLAGHAVFAGSDRAMDLVLDDLESLERRGRIGPATYGRLREMILRSPHFASRSSPSPRASAGSPRRTPGPPDRISSTPLIPTSAVAAHRTDRLMTLSVLILGLALINPKKRKLT
jgi:hypothetical protein